ncbi:MAG: AgmX/PglI C-terminal domain-containing protein [Myxococcales bacterium]|nr:AgmX/PglI C-terminal domain-containing protein [Myxococcales bacterium]
MTSADLVASDTRHAGTADIVRAGVRAHLPDMRTCYEGLLVGQPTLAGTVVASFDIAPDGVVTQAAAKGVSRELETCVASAIKQIKFAIATDGAVHIKAYPIEFKP